MQAKVEDDAWDGWQQFLDEAGVSYSAMIEALGRSFAQGERAVEIEDVVAAARRVDAERRKR